MEGTLRSNVVSRIEWSEVDDIRRLYKPSRETNLGFVSKGNLLFPPYGGEEKESASIVLGKLSARWQDKILEVYKVEDLGFSSLVEFYLNK